MNRSIEDISEYLVSHDLFGSAPVSDSAIFECNDARGIAGREINIVKNNDDRALKFFSCLPEQFHHFNAACNIQIIERLIKKDVVRFLA